MREYCVDTWAEVRSHPSTSSGSPSGERSEVSRETRIRDSDRLVSSDGRHGFIVQVIQAAM
jgi:hypothetical protein